MLARSQRRRGILGVAATLALLLIVPPLPTTAQDDPCTADGGPGGDWPMYGHDLAGTRHQTAEGQTIDATNVGNLDLVWTTGGAVGSGQSTAVVAGRCVYIAEDSNGTLTALELETGAMVWQVQPVAPSYPEKIQTAAVAVVDGVVYANASEADGSRAAGAAPVAVARDADTGALVYESEPVFFGQPTTAFSSAVVADGLQLVVTNGGDGVPSARPGYAIVDTATGLIVHSQTTIPTRDLDEGYAGGGQWATPIVDPESGYAFNGTANPYSKKKEHRYDNAILKIDMDRDRTATFGSIVDAYKGDVDQFIAGLDRQPLCDMFGDDIGYHPCCNFSVTCVQLDIDFGASPTSWRNSAGELLIGEMQKNGVFHVVYAETMQSAWRALLGSLNTLSATGGNAASAANDGRRIYVTANPGIVYALDGETGRIQWTAAIGDIAEYRPVALANGVVYVIGNNSILFAFDARDGRLLTAKWMPVDGQEFCFGLGGGVTVAHNTVLANCDGVLFAYRLPL